MSEEVKQNYTNFIKLLSIVSLIIVFIVILYFIFSSNTAGYRHLQFTSSQVEIIPLGSEWDDRTIIKDKEILNDIMLHIEDSTLDNNTKLKCDVEKHREIDEENFVQLIIRRSFAKDDLSWKVCTENKVTYLTPLINDGSLYESYKTDIELMSLLKENIKKND